MLVVTVRGKAANVPTHSSKLLPDIPHVRVQRISESLKYVSKSSDTGALWELTSEIYPTAERGTRLGTVCNCQQVKKMLRA